MPSFRCVCDSRIGYGQIPSPAEWLIIGDVAFNAFSGQVESEDVYRAMTHALKCPNCHRLWIFENGFSSQPVCYRPDIG